jgi:hypothetical protein
LDKSAATRSPTDRVPDHAVPGTKDDPQAPVLCRVHRLSQTCAVQAPERREGGGVHLEDAAPAKTAGAAKRRARRDRRQHNRPVKDKKVQTFLHFKTRFQKAALFVGRQRARNDPLETLHC